MANSLIIEFFIIFILLPSLLFFLKSTIITFFFLYLVFTYSILILRAGQDFSFSILKKRISTKFIIINSLIFIISAFSYTILLDESLLFKLPSEHFKLWLIVMIVYPFFSVIPQELIYRVFFFYRYKSLFKNNEIFLVAINTLVFSLGHIVFDNIHAVLITAIVSPIFSYAYLKKSFLTCFIIHSIGGQILFTFGLGEFFY